MEQEFTFEEYNCLPSLYCVIVVLLTLAFVIGIQTILLPISAP